SSLSLCELDVGLPELLIAPVGDVRAQQIGALRERGPIVEGGVVIGPETEACRAAVRLQRDGEAGGGTLVLLQDAADLPVHRRKVSMTRDFVVLIFTQCKDRPARLGRS